MEREYTCHSRAPVFIGREYDARIRDPFITQKVLPLRPIKKIMRE